MKCPLLNIGVSLHPGVYDKTATDCIKKKCGWWDKQQDCCVICTIAGELDALHYFAKGIRDRMPKDLAPR